MGAAIGRATGGGEEVGVGADSQFPHRGAFELRGGRVVPRRVDLYLIYVECIAGLDEFSLSYVWSYVFIVFFRRSSWWVQQVVTSDVTTRTTFFACLIGEVKRVVLVGCC